MAIRTALGQFSLTFPADGDNRGQAQAAVAGAALLVSLKTMHELAIGEALLEQLAALAGQHGWPRLSRVWVRVGLLSGVVPEALEFAFDALSAGTPAEGAELVLETEPGRFACGHCGEFDLDRLTFACPQCAGPLRLLRASRELSLSGVEVLTS